MTQSYYETYWSPNGFNPEQQIWPELQSVYERFIRPGAKVLDLGCGDGSTSGPWITSRGSSYLGVDVSNSGVETARGRGLNASVIEDAADTGLPGDTFDVVTCIEVLEHLFLPLEAAREIHRVLKPGGIVIVTTPNVSYWRSRLNLLLLGRFDPIGDELSKSQPWRDPHIRFFSPRTLSTMLESAGFDIVIQGGQQGGLLNGLPWLRRWRTSRHQSRIYRALENRWPNLFAFRTCVVARAR